MHVHIPAIVRLVVLAIIIGTQGGAPGLSEISPVFSQHLPPIPPMDRPLGGPSFSEPTPPNLPTGPQLGGPCGFELGQINIDLKATATGPFSVQLTWAGPMGEYQISGPVEATVAVKPMLPHLGSPTPHSPNTGKIVPHTLRTTTGRYEHSSRLYSSPVLPDTDYNYVIRAVLPDGKKACGTAKAHTLPPPPITDLVGRYVSPNDIRFQFELPPYVNAINIYRENVTKGWEPGDRKRVYQITRDTAFNLPWNPANPAELRVTDPELPPLPNDYSRPPAYDFTIEAVWFDGDGKPARTVKAPYHIDGPKPIWGFADTHAHQFANLAFGGLFVWGKVWDENGGGISGALPWCDWWPESWWPLPPGASAPPFGTPYRLFNPKRFIVHGPAGTNDHLGALVASEGDDLMPDHPVGGYNTFDGWPKWNSVSHQMMYYEWLKRAYDGGMRLMVMHAVNSKYLCNKITRIYNCDDMDAVDRQLKAAHDLEAFIDNQSGGTGKGWYRIVRSPQEARQAISNNQMAIVLGIEVPDLFGCASTPSQCADANGKLLPHVINELNKYTGPGYDVRHLFPIHSFDNAFGGTAFFQDQYRVAQRLLTQQEVSVRICSSEGIEFIFDTNNPSSWFSKAISGGEVLRGFDEYPFAVCNAIGLNQGGRNFIKELMARHIIIDIDHMSHLAQDQVLQLAQQRSYPVVSGHTGILEVSVGKTKRHEAQQTESHLQEIAKLGGMGGVITSQGKVENPGRTIPVRTTIAHHGNRIDVQGEVVIPRRDGIRSYGNQVKNDCSNSSKTFAQAYLAAIDDYGLSGVTDHSIPLRDRAAVSFGTDMQGAIIQPGPRFGQERCTKDWEIRTILRSNVPYPPASVNVNVLGVGEQPESTRVIYPFTLPGFATLDKSEAFPGGKKYDINVDGIAHVGMLPDFIEDLRHIGMTDNDLKPLFRSAEGYIRMWERASY